MHLTWFDIHVWLKTRLLYKLEIERHLFNKVIKVITFKLINLCEAQRWVRRTKICYIAGAVSLLKNQLYFYIPETNNNRKFKAIFYHSKKKKKHIAMVNWEVYRLFSTVTTTLPAARIHYLSHFTGEGDEGPKDEVPCSRPTVSKWFRSEHASISHQSPLLSHNTTQPLWGQCVELHSKVFKAHF